MLAGMFAITTVCIYSLARYDGAAMASVKPAPIEQQIHNVLTRLESRSPKDSQSHRVSDTIKIFYRDIGQQQIPLDQLRGNPFVFTVPGGLGPPKQDDQASSATPDAGRQAIALSEALRAAGQLQLQAVLKNSQGRSIIISGSLLSEGQMINGWTVSEIHARKVVLEWNGHTYVLSMPR